VKILVSIKRVIDHTVKVRVKPDGSGVDSNLAKMSINPFDEIAVEEALRLKEQGVAEEVVVVSIGVPAVQETIRHALALGADRGIHVEALDSPEPLAVAKVLKALVALERPGLLILGKQAIDDDCNQVAQMVSALADWSQATFVSKLTIGQDKAIVVREIDGGLETLELPLPAVISTDLRLNTPRYATLPNIMKSKQKPIKTMTLDELGVDATPRLKTLRVSEPSARQAGTKVTDWQEVIPEIYKAMGRS
jgi:electron transfer flavoprotein beta subunit